MNKDSFQPSDVGRSAAPFKILEKIMEPLRGSMDKDVRRILTASPSLEDSPLGRGWTSALYQDLVIALSHYYQTVRLSREGKRNSFEAMPLGFLIDKLLTNTDPPDGLSVRVLRR